MSQADLARLAGLSQQAIAAYENGRITPPFHVQARLAAILGVPARELFPEQQGVA